MTFPFLNQKEKKAIEVVKMQLADKYPCLIRNGYLFGSKARGDFTQESDIDLLFIADHLDSGLRREIVYLVSDAGFDEGVFFSPKVMDVAHFNRLKNSHNPFLTNVEKEGEALW